MQKGKRDWTHATLALHEAAVPGVAALQTVSCVVAILSAEIYFEGRGKGNIAITSRVSYKTVVLIAWAGFGPNRMWGKNPSSGRKKQFMFYAAFGAPQKLIWIGKIVDVDIFLNLRAHSCVFRWPTPQDISHRSYIPLVSLAKKNPWEDV